MLAAQYARVTRESVDDILNVDNVQIVSIAHRNCK